MKKLILTAVLMLISIQGVAQTVNDPLGVGTLQKPGDNPADGAIVTPDSKHHAGTRYMVKRNKDRKYRIKAHTSTPEETKRPQAGSNY
jgi:hypothetical protein